MLFSCSRSGNWHAPLFFKGLRLFRGDLPEAIDRASDIVVGIHMRQEASPAHGRGRAESLAISIACMRRHSVERRGLRIREGISVYPMGDKIHPRGSQNPKLCLSPHARRPSETLAISIACGRARWIQCASTELLDFQGVMLFSGL